MNWNLKLISGELGKIYNIDEFYGMGEWECENHPAKFFEFLPLLRRMGMLRLQL
ncbi:hypothetical protein [Chryseobacterium sp. AG844]|uniref:hypothetical protein n=1 Tax=Chryseobacterium sp. AG844 TaxID=2183998 RepID=UPI0015E8323D|nr:hypothetical protein [Chryseobacterium sp. AG844]